MYSFSLRSCKFWTNYIWYFFDPAKYINNSVRFASIFPNSIISGFVSLRYLKDPYYRSIVSLRFDIVAIATPNPLSRKRLCLPPELKGGGGAHSPAGGGVGEPQFRRLEKKLCTLPILCFPFSRQLVQDSFTRYTEGRKKERKHR